MTRGEVFRLSNERLINLYQQEILPHLRKQQRCMSPLGVALHNEIARRVNIGCLYITPDQVHELRLTAARTQETWH